MTEPLLTKATVTIPGGLIISLEGPSADDVLKMLETIVRQCQGADHRGHKKSRQGVHVYNADIEKEIVDFAVPKAEGFTFYELRNAIHRAEPAVRMALDTCLQQKKILIANARYRSSKRGRYTVLYKHNRY